MAGLALLPDIWLWHLGVSGWPLALAILWWVPSLLLLLAEVGLQMGFFHKLSVRILFTTILFSVMPKVVFILFDFMMPWFFALLPALALMGWFAFGFIEGWKRLEITKKQRIFAGRFTFKDKDYDRQCFIYKRNLLGSYASGEKAQTRMGR